MKINIRLALIVGGLFLSNVGYAAEDFLKRFADKKVDEQLKKYHEQEFYLFYKTCNLREAFYKLPGDFDEQTRLGDLLNGLYWTEAEAQKRLDRAVQIYKQKEGQDRNIEHVKLADFCEGRGISSTRMPRNFLYGHHMQRTLKSGSGRGKNYINDHYQIAKGIVQWEERDKQFGYQLGGAGPITQEDQKKEAETKAAIATAQTPAGTILAHLQTSNAQLKKSEKIVRCGCLARILNRWKEKNA